MQQYSSPLEHGLQIITRPANPAVATGFVYTPHVERIEQLVSVYYLFDTDANAADRRLYLRVSDGTGPILDINTNFDLVANTLTLQSWLINSDNFLNTNGAIVDQSNNFLPPNLIFPRAATLTLLLANVQAGDQVSNIVIITNTWARP